MLHCRAALLRHARLADALVMHERALEIHKPRSVPRTHKTFFIHVVHSPSGIVGHVVASDLPSRGGKA
jgi:hypothetical protein